jgi:hypothetical protein
VLSRLFWRLFLEKLRTFEAEELTFFRALAQLPTRRYLPGDGPPGDQG